MKTHTITVGTAESIVAICNDWENRGWAVRQIVPHPSLSTTLVVMETDNPVSGASLPEPRSFTGTAVNPALSYSIHQPSWSGSYESN